VSTTETDRILTVTDAAASKIADLLTEESEEGLGLRVKVQPGGCSGFRYEMYFDNVVSDGDDVNQVTDAVKVLVDSASAQMLQGATLDFVNTISEQGFNIENPNASNSCGCGNSFS
jgi:iron-sulfur cluster assembly accessory protein